MTFFSESNLFMLIRAHFSKYSQIIYLLIWELDQTELYVALEPTMPLHLKMETIFNAFHCLSVIV